MTVWILCFLNAVNMSVWLFLAFIDFSRQRQFWLLPVPQILHFVNGSDCLPGFPAHPTLCACRLSGISCAVWLDVGDWTAVGGVSFVFMSRGTLTILLFQLKVHQVPPLGRRHCSHYTNCVLVLQILSCYYLQYILWLSWLAKGYEAWVW